MKRTNIYFPPKQKEALERICEETGLSFAEHVRRAVDLYIEELRKKDDSKPK